ncbi:methyltransferase domain-containing protein [Streptomyces sp. WAC05374]|uniref:methyltransferase n=1 Tax=Streptomyces sp. WAC05374 TaxID=2487420 RepID=UPI000F88470A|nr:methyltransferase [Streptomyces sp. WAC05374]RST16430.1 methyltransferase domain-containing protein [Streptomyces sp. WAC05374]TDF43573.1 methyltransferase domain-containing protein [Streptomyces sp. WAC05374]TDF51525.1 methyltransferase domain-containing protein [Streptomyces sp. WAC05374]TDF53320.1 methyltransferase domain-containing protein [Streptomyces sp. WAC05374]
MNRLTTSWGDYALARFPEDPRDRLRAWDAADEYLLRHLQEAPLPGRGTVVVVGDRWGALVTSLARHRPGQVVQITDSYLAREATRANLARTGLDEKSVRLLTTRDTPPERVDVLLVRVPKSLALLEDQLHRLAPAVHAGTLVAGTGMVKEIHTSTLALFERIIGPTRTSLAVRKARLIHTTPDPALPRTPSPWPHRYALPGDAPAAVAGRTVVNHAGIFCADRLDIGTRFFLQHLPRGLGGSRVVDLGCGNGVVGLAVALTDPGAQLLFTDESYQAVASAEETFRAGAAPGAEAEFLVGDGLTGVPAGSVDLVLNNPPFHSHQATTDLTARRMFSGARRALRSGGELWVVGNRHLGYHVTLRRVFGNCEVVASDPKFVILRAVRT